MVWHFTMLGNSSSQTAWAIIRLSKPRTLCHEARDEIFQARLSPRFLVEEPGYEAMHTHIRKGYIPLTEFAVSVLLASTGMKS